MDGLRDTEVFALIRLSGMACKFLRLTQIASYA
jgi:hypothetical protein